MKKYFIVAPILFLAVSCNTQPVSNNQSQPEAATQEQVAEAEGTIEGSLIYPSEELPPEIKICAENNVSKQLICTQEHLKDKKFKTGIGYKLRVLAGSYVVFATLDSMNQDRGIEYRAYYSEFVTCGYDASCKSHKPITVTVQGGQTVEKVEPGDWYNQ